MQRKEYNFEEFKSTLLDYLYESEKNIILYYDYIQIENEVEFIFFYIDDQHIYNIFKGKVKNSIFFIFKDEFSLLSESANYNLSINAL